MQFKVVCLLLVVTVLAFVNAKPQPKPADQDVLKNGGMQRAFQLRRLREHLQTTAKRTGVADQHSRRIKQLAIIEQQITNAAKRQIQMKTTVNKRQLGTEESSPDSYTAEMALENAVNYLESLQMATKTLQMDMDDAIEHVRKASLEYGDAIRSEALLPGSNNDCYGQTNMDNGIVNTIQLQQPFPCNGGQCALSCDGTPECSNGEDEDIWLCCDWSTSMVCEEYDETTGTQQYVCVPGYVCPQYRCMDDTIAIACNGEQECIDPYDLDLGADENVGMCCDWRTSVVCWDNDDTPTCVPGYVCPVYMCMDGTIATACDGYGECVLEDPNYPDYAADEDVWTCCDWRTNIVCEEWDSMNAVYTTTCMPGNECPSWNYKRGEGAMVKKQGPDYSKRLLQKLLSNIKNKE